MKSSMKKIEDIRIDKNDIQKVFKKMDLDTPAKRQLYQYNVTEKPQIQYEMIYTTKSGGPLKDA